MTPKGLAGVSDSIRGRSPFSLLPGALPSEDRRPGQPTQIIVNYPTTLNPLPCNKGKMSSVLIYDSSVL